MIPIERGATWSLSECIYGDEEKERKPIKEFINEIKSHENWLEVALKIEGLICGRSIHASGVIIYNEEYYKNNAMMKAPNGQEITQWSMDDSTYAGGLKYDYLTVKNYDAIRHCINMLLDAGYIKWQGSLRRTYNKYFHPDVLDYETKKMWEMVDRNEVVDLFQFSTDVGLNAAKKIKPRSLGELCTANAVMRLSVSDGMEQPIDTYIRYKEDISEWYKCMREKYHLTEDEIKIMEVYQKDVYGLSTMQEEVMRVSMDERVSKFSMQEANKLRKSIAKKKKKLQEEMKKELFERGHEIGTSDNLLNYVWNEIIGKQLGYSFSLPHILAYTTVAVIELNLAYRFPIIYWNTACLIVDAGTDEEVEENKTTQYGKMATAIANMQQRGIKISLPLINEAGFGFTPDETNNRIIYSMKAISGIGEDMVREIIKNRPYKSFDDFMKRMVQTKIIKNSAMINLIKAGAFTELDNLDRRKTMYKYFEYTVTGCSKLTMQQFNTLLSLDEEFDFIPESLDMAIEHKLFKDYVIKESNVYKLYIQSGKKIPNKGYHDRYLKLDQRAMEFFKEYYNEDSVVGLLGESYIISEKQFLKQVDGKLEELKAWMSKEETIEQYNYYLREREYKKYASGTVAKWEMEALNIYTEPHELNYVDEDKYFIKNYFELSKEPKIYDYYGRNIKQTINGKDKWTKKWFPKYEIIRIAGTILDKDKNKHKITLLTTYGVVNVKFNKGQFLNYDKQISRINDDGTKTTIEKSWISRGNKVLLCGFRKDDQFRVYNYTDTIFPHTCNLIVEVLENGELKLKTERDRVKEIESIK